MLLTAVAPDTLLPLTVSGWDDIVDEGTCMPTEELVAVPA
jgi:hypothetical protein